MTRSFNPQVFFVPRSALVVGSVDRASEGAAKECEALLDALESLSVLLADALLVDEGAAVDEAVVATALGSSALVLLPPPTTDISQMSRPATTTSITTAAIRRRM